MSLPWFVKSLCASVLQILQNMPICFTNIYAEVGILKETTKVRRSSLKERFSTDGSGQILNDSWANLVST